MSVWHLQLRKRGTQQRHFNLLLCLDSHPTLMCHSSTQSPTQVSLVTPSDHILLISTDAVQTFRKKKHKFHSVISKTIHNTTLAYSSAMFVQLLRWSVIPPSYPGTQIIKKLFEHLPYPVRDLEAEGIMVHNRYIST